MTPNAQLRFARRSRSPQGLLGKLLSLILGVAFLFFAFTFALAALAIIAIGGVMLGGWLWWKTRKLRRQLRENGAEPADSRVIEGEFTHADDSANQSNNR